MRLRDLHFSKRRFRLQNGFNILAKLIGSTTDYPKKDAGLHLPKLKKSVMACNLYTSNEGAESDSPAARIYI
jgi:hypothetical protein